MSGACETCGSKLGPANRSGYCRKHFSAAISRDPEHGAKISRGLKRRLHADPALMEVYRQNARAASQSEACDRARRKRDWAEIRAMGQAASQSPEARAKAGRTLSARRLAWCPGHLRADYLHLVNVKHIKAAEAREIILAQEAAEIERMRRGMAA